MKFISWNTNGIRACKDKGFDAFFDAENADFFCVQETKMQEGQADLEKKGYHLFMSSAERKGYSGTLIYAKEELLHSNKPINEIALDLNYESFSTFNNLFKKETGLTPREYRKSQRKTKP